MTGLDSYIIKGGEQGKSRMKVIARVVGPATTALLDAIGPLDGGTVINAGCGAGEASFLLADRVGSAGKVIGLDLDETKLMAARDEASARGLENLEFREASLLEPWPVRDADFVLIRFVLTHVTNPELMLARARAALASGGVIAVQDIDYRGRICDPPSAAHDRYCQLYIAAAQRSGGDPFIGARLGRLLEAAGFAHVEVALAQPFGRSADLKATAPLTLAGIADRLVALGLASREELARLALDLEADVARPDTSMGAPRIFAAWGRL